MPYDNVFARGLREDAAMVHKSWVQENCHHPVDRVPNLQRKSRPAPARSVKTRTDHTAPNYWNLLPLIIITLPLFLSLSFSQALSLTPISHANPSSPSKLQDLSCAALPYSITSSARLHAVAPLPHGLPFAFAAQESTSRTP